MYSEEKTSQNSEEANNFNDKINSKQKYIVNNLMKTINNAYFSPKTLMKLNGVIINSMIINDGMFIKMDNPNDISNLSDATLEFNHDFFNHRLQLKLSKYGDLLLVDEVLSSSHTYQSESIVVEDYGIIKLFKKNVVIRVIEISEEKMLFNILRKDEDLMLTHIDKKIIVEMNNFGKDFTLAICPKLHKIANSVMIMETEIFFKNEVEANNFYNFYISRVKKGKLNKEKAAQINNTISKLLELKQ